MEDVLAVYKRSYDETHPLVCMDESSKQHIKETRQPIPAKPGTVEKYDTEYERNGVSNMFMFFEPLEGKTACGGNGSKNGCGLGASNSQPG